MPRLYRRWSHDQYQALHEVAKRHEQIMDAMKRAMETSDPKELVEMIKQTQRTTEEAHSTLSALILGFIKED